MLCLIDSALCSRFCIVIGSRCKLLICHRFILYCGLALLLHAYEQSFVLCRVAAQLKREPFLLDDLILSLIHILPKTDRGGLRCLCCGGFDLCGRLCPG